MFRCIFSARNAEYQVRALSIGSTIASLSPGEAQLAGSISTKTTGLNARGNTGDCGWPKPAAGR